MGAPTVMPVSVAVLIVLVFIRPVSIIPFVSGFVSVSVSVTVPVRVSRTIATVKVVIFTVTCMPSVSG